MDWLKELWDSFTSTILSFFGSPAEAAVKPMPEPLPAATSENYDRQFDARQPAIESLQQMAASHGKTLPEEFVRSLYQCGAPYWKEEGDKEKTYIFNKDGSLTPGIADRITAYVSSGKMDVEAAHKDEHYHTVMSGKVFVENREALLEKFEQQAGIALDPDIRKTLKNVGVVEYNDAQGHYRQINLNAGNAPLINSELEELARFTGAPVHIDAGESAEKQASAISALSKSEREQRESKQRS